MANHPSHDSGVDYTYKLVGNTMVKIPHPHSSLPYQEPQVRNEWVSISASPTGVGSLQATKTVAISCMDPYNQWKYSELSAKSDGSFGALATKSMLLEAKSTAGSPAVATGCCAWPPADVRPPTFLPPEARIDMQADAGTLTQQSYNAMTLSSANGPTTVQCDNGDIIITAVAKNVTIKAAKNVTIEAPAGMTINANVTVNGSITATGDVIGAGKSLSKHTHAVINHITTDVPT